MNVNSNDVTVIDGATDATTTVPAGVAPNTVAVDQVRNKIYVVNLDGNCTTIIDGKTNTSTTIGNIGNGAADLAVDVLTNRFYVMNNAGSEIPIFSVAGGPFPIPLLDELTGPVNGVR